PYGRTARFGLRSRLWGLPRQSFHLALRADWRGKPRPTEDGTIRLTFTPMRQATPYGTTARWFISFCVTVQDT
ncbi:MAG: hypothetical protein ABI456_06500, partial [Ktedonobacteraceae bacterium]